MGAGGSSELKMRVSRTKFVILIAMSVIGLLAASEVLFSYYLFKQSLPFCTVGNVGGIALDCNRVLGSSYSQIFGIPLELFAVAYFVINLVLVYLVTFGGDRVFGKALTTLFGWRFVGLMIVPYLVFVEFIVLKAVCVYCTIMHGAIIADFVVISYFLFFRRNALWEEGGESDLQSGVSTPTSLQ
jgi:uncharacterized membrane protein